MVEEIEHFVVSTCRKDFRNLQGLQEVDEANIDLLLTLRCVRGDPEGEIQRFLAPTESGEKHRSR